MKTIRKVWSIGLVVVLLASMLLSVAPASAGTLTFSQDSTTPSLTNKILRGGVDIFDFAVNGNTIYAVGTDLVDVDGLGTDDDADTSILYKSTDGGYSWSNIGGNLPAAIVNTNLVAVAPDNADIVVVVDSVTAAAVVSTNGGSSFSNLNLVTVVAGLIFDVDISALSGSTRYIAVAGSAAANTPCLMYFNLGAAAPAWVNALNDPAWDSDPGAGTTYFAAAPVIDNMRAVKFSPNFPSDLTVVAISEEIGAAPGAGVVKMHAASFNTKKWDNIAGTYSAYPVTVTSNAGSATTTYAVNNASLVLDPAFLGGDDTSRVGFVGLEIVDSAAAERGGIFRFKDTTVKALKETTGIKSVAWDGTNLVAGPSLTNVVYRCADALVSSPTVSSAAANKRPGVDTAGAVDEDIVVAWVGANVIAGSIGNESGIFISKDNGKSFNGIALIDTIFGAIIDVAVAADGSSVYMLTADAALPGGDVSLWRYSNSRWERIMVIDAATAAGYIVRVAPTDANAVYVAALAATEMWYATDAGENRWFVRACRYNIADLAVETKDIAYVGINAAATVTKTTNGGFTWGDAKSTSLQGGNIYTIVSIAADKLLVGSTNGYVSYSADGNANWTKIDKQLAPAGAGTQVTATGLAANEYIFASTTGTAGAAAATVQRWQIGVSTSWKDLAAPITSVVAPAEYFGVYGLALVNGVLYAVAEDTVVGNNNSELVRTLNPTADTPTWVNAPSAGETFNTAPSALRTSTGSVKLWFIDTTGVGLWSFTDTMADTKVTLSGPAANVISPLNPITGRSVDIAFNWAKPSDGVTNYTIRVYTDASGTQQVVNHAVASTDSSVTVMIGPYQALTAQYEFAPGKTYYWRVRTAAPVISPWSEMRSFTIEPTAAEVPAILSPANGADSGATRPSFSWSPVAQATEYQFVLALNPYLTAPIIDVKTATTAYRPLAELEAGTTYYWAVKATKPVAGAFSAVANFTVAEVAPEATTAAPPVVITQVPAPTIVLTQPPVTTTSIVIPQPTPAPQIAPAYIWAVIIIGAILV
ncbi:MAG: hypothetical protein PHR43_06040, partial [Dehalococcoidales bacterium]|nr:hypothetical protein [Dehalococcoidales bacterium]